eukprot:23973_1
MGDILPAFSSAENNQNAVLPKLPIVYSSGYNIGFMKLESLHPFDSRKYEKIYNGLIKSTRIKSKQFIEPSEPCDHATLELVHPPSYLNTLNDSSVVAQLVEVPPVSFLPNALVQTYLLSPMRLATKGSLIAAEKAYSQFGWSINLSGGYHHASATHGGGFCIYSDISLMIVHLTKKYGDTLHKIMILDLDAHQGNGHENDKANDIFKQCGADVFTVDFYNNGIYPHDTHAKRGIDVDVPLRHHTKDKEYMRKLKETLPKCLDEFEPQLVIYNAGTDILKGDPLGALDISEQGVIERDSIVFHECFERNIAIVMLLSGGYQQCNADVITKSILNLDDMFGLFEHPNKLSLNDLKI